MGIDIATADSLAQAVADRDLSRLGGMVSEDVRMRALLPSGLVDFEGRAAVLAEFDRWFGTLDSVRLAQSSNETVADRLLTNYRLELARGDQRWLCAQTVVCEFDGGLVATLDLLCSGFRPW